MLWRRVRVRSTPSSEVTVSWHERSSMAEGLMPVVSVTLWLPLPSTGLTDSQSTSSVIFQLQSASICRATEVSLPPSVTLLARRKSELTVKFGSITSLHDERRIINEK